MGFLFTSLLLMVVSVCLGRTNPILGSNTTNPMDSEHSGTGEPGSNFSEGFDGGKDLNVVWNASPDLTVNHTTELREPSPIGTHIMEFINQHMIYIIIAGVLLVLVIVSVCTALLVRQNYKASAYYPASYPQQTYVDEQEKEGAVKAFSEVPDQLGGPPRVEAVDCSSQLKADILAAAHSLKRTLPPKAEGDVTDQTPARGGSERLPQAVGREEGDKATPEVGEQVVEQGPNSKATEDNRDGGKATMTSGTDGESDQESPTLTKEEEEEEEEEKEKEGKRESGVKEETIDEEGEEQEGGEARGEKAGPGEETNAKSGSHVDENKPRETPQSEAEKQAPGESEAEGSDKPLRPTVQEAEEVKPAAEDLTGGSKAAEPGPEGLGDQEKTPLIPKQDSATGDTTAM